MNTLSFNTHGGLVEQMSLDEVMKASKDAGCDGFELAVLPKWLDVNDDADVDRVRGIVETCELSIPVLSCHAISPTAADLSDQWTPYMRRCIEVAPRLGANVILLWPNLKPGQDKAQALSTLRDNVLGVLDEASSAGITFAMEFEKDHALDNYREGVGFIYGVDARLGLTADTFHMFNDGVAPYKTVVETKDFIKNVHLSDSCRLGPGKGLFDFYSFLRALRDIGYDGNMSFQFKVEKIEQIAESVEFIRSVLQSL